MNGKTTLFKVLTDPEYVNPESKIHSSPKTASYNTNSIHSQLDNRSYQLNIIDTPGLREIKNEKDKESNDTTIVDVIRQCLVGHIRKISCICLVFSTNIHQDDLNAFETLKAFLGEEMSMRTMMGN
ncbi:unnamed protein product [Rotaria sordida]|uniref:AIG1-type G domain-containing protein n=1 Tax=Rotaria sordida TaxID=392033 RepID=A0A815DND1_9BILA|nr:unnamed protein product [Rotaria sordida]CAF3943101.1 unnamed protein product [Rotaria sordida]